MKTDLAQKLLTYCKMALNHSMPAEHDKPHALHSMTDPLISRDPEVLGGTPVFAETRVPIRTLFDYVEAGESASRIP